MNNQGINTSPTSLRRRFFLLVILAALGSVSFVRAQTTSFTYQGRLTDGATAANATYDMQFKLFDTASAGSQIGSTITNGAVPVSNGVFTVQLDYGAAAFSGADRYLEIGVRLAGDANPYTILAPRQQLTSAVYAIRAGSSTSADTATNASTATNATKLGGVDAGQYVQTNDSRLADARIPTAGSSNYIQNTAALQPASNFNISGNGTVGGTLSANAVNTTTDFSIAGSPVLRVSGTAPEANSNTFTGIGAGNLTTTGSRNSFYGRKSGESITFGFNNSFFGDGAGQSTKSGVFNSFFGERAGNANTSGNSNSFFGRQSGFHNIGAHNNSFFGDVAGLNNTTGEGNSFFGSTAGQNNVTGEKNSFFGYQAGQGNGNSNNTTLIGYRASVAIAGLTNATAIGSLAEVAQSNSLVLGSIKGTNFGEEDTNVGIGTSAPNARFHIKVNTGNILMGDAGCNPSFIGIGFGTALSGCANYSLIGNGTDTIINRPTGGVISFRENNVAQLQIASGGAIIINTLGSGGATSLCRNAFHQISDCSSSLRYKTNIQPFMSGLSVLDRLRPITFDWKQGGMHDLGFGAEDIAAIEPLLVTRNDKGQIEGVKYDRITAVLVNAVKEQQEQIKQQQRQIQSLKRLVCQRNRRAAVCR